MMNRSASNSTKDSLSKLRRDLALLSFSDSPHREESGTKYVIPLDPTDPPESLDVRDPTKYVVRDMRKAIEATDRWDVPFFTEDDDGCCPTCGRPWES